jgi:hypothetical protein
MIPADKHPGFSYFKFTHSRQELNLYLCKNRACNSEGLTNVNIAINLSTPEERRTYSSIRGYHPTNQNLS